MATTRVNDFEEGTSGVAITTVNSGGAGELVPNAQQP